MKTRYIVQDCSGDHQPSPGYTWRFDDRSAARAHAAEIAKTRESAGMDVDVRLSRESDGELIEDWR